MKSVYFIEYTTIQYSQRSGKKEINSRRYLKAYFKKINNSKHDAEFYGEKVIRIIYPSDLDFQIFLIIMNLSSEKLFIKIFSSRVRNGMEVTAACSNKLFRKNTKSTNTDFFMRK